MSFKFALAALAIAVSSITSACAGFPGVGGNPCEVAGASAAETPKLCVIRAAQLTRAAYATIGEQLAAGVITADQAASAKVQVDKVAEAVTAAAAALPLADGTTADRLAFLEGLVLELLRAQAARQ